ncbi:hypothetical protein RHSIM_Rhsim02G0078600 [Rhododendron simsii]|uniref:FAR1 domain-containing protein n=1 Tax=Rhododendron simsii TaxID=118357 RepID=A0A834LVS4_RHOSS|nr:hypothetical protein RHSIM_Rhsim02G0078600 [Rhododendron simsii]
MISNVNSDEGARPIESCPAGGPILEPFEGLEFRSEEAAKVFYDDYARRVGFVMRAMSCRRSEIDGKILARQLGCNKEGHCLSTQGTLGSVRKQRESTREGCKAMILVKSDKDGKWVVTKFVKDHNHPLVTASREVRPAMSKVATIGWFIWKGRNECFGFNGSPVNMRVLIRVLVSLEDRGVDGQVTVSSQAKWPPLPVGCVIVNCDAAMV